MDQPTDTPRTLRPVAVVGTGTMGRGIAQVALAAGHPVLLHDAGPGRAAEAAAAIGARLDRQVAKGALTADGRDAAMARLTAADRLADLAGAALVVEAVLEDLQVKRALFAELEGIVADDCLLATNTSSLSVTAVGGALKLPGRLLGLHFFNPAPVMPLVEVVCGAATDPAAADRAQALVRAWGKTAVRCADTPGFIVNRVARPFYAEAFRLYEEGAADPATIDAVLRESGGFPMGPFELTDLIGQDVNAAVTRSVWESFHHSPKFTPSLAQVRLVESGRLGRKSGHGWYAYGEGASRPEPHTAPPGPAPARVAVSGTLGPAEELVVLAREAGIEVERTEAHNGSDGALLLPDGTRLYLTDGASATDGEYPPHAPHDVVFDLALDYRAATRVAVAPADGTPPEALASAAGFFQALGKRVSVVDDVPGLIVARTVAMLVDFAADAAARGVASPSDVDTAMRLGANHPLGPLEWGDRLDPWWVWDVLDSLEREYPGGRYAPSRSLRRRWLADRTLLTGERRGTVDGGTVDGGTMEERVDEGGPGGGAPDGNDPDLSGPDQSGARRRSGGGPAGGRADGSRRDG